MSIAAIIADDFSSATDCGVQFSIRGLKTAALMQIPDLSHRPEYDVASVDTDSRADTPEAAYGRVSKAAEFVRHGGYRYVYKSVDSTLRGNLGAEIDAMLDVLRPEFAFVAPAFPYWGRKTVNGCHFLNGILISDSQFADDPVWPIKEADLVRLLGSQTRRRVGLIDICGVRGERKEIEQRLQGMRDRGYEIVVFDAETEDDLKRVAGIAATSDHSNLIVGSTGLAQYLADAWGISRDSKPLRIPNRTGPFMVVSGSASPTTRNQIERFAADPDTVSQAIDPREIVAERHVSGLEERIYAKLQAVPPGRDVALFLDSTPQSVRETQALGEARGLSRPEVSGMIMAALARIASRFVASHPVKGILLTGGDTAKAVCGELGASGMILLTEVEPGIPLGVLLGPREVAVVTKAGAFGSDEALNRARRLLRAGDADAC